LIQFLPPDGFTAQDALMVVLAAQIDPRVPVLERLAWVFDHDPTLKEAA
jgi:hypothetical protein